MIKATRRDGESWRVPAIVVVVLVLSSIGATFVVSWMLRDDPSTSESPPPSDVASAPAHSLAALLHSMERQHPGAVSVGARRDEFL